MGGGVACGFALVPLRFSLFVENRAVVFNEMAI